MKKKQYRLIGALCVIMLLCIGLSGCFSESVLESVLESTQGTIVDARSGTEASDGKVQASSTGMDGFTITLTAVNDSTKTKTATTSADGTWTIPDIDPGTYKMSVAKSGWYIPDRVVEVSGFLDSIADVPAFELNADDYDGLSFILVWNDQVNNLDLHLTFPTDQPTLSYAPDEYLRNAISSGDSTVRDSVSPESNKSEYPFEATDPVIYMDRDDMTKYGPETINLVYTPHTTAHSTLNTATYANGLSTIIPDGSTGIQFFGTSVLYVNSYATDGTAEKDLYDAEAQVYVIQTKVNGSDVTANELAIFSIPMPMTKASLMQVHLFGYDDGSGSALYFLLVPDLSIWTGGDNSAPNFRGLTQNGAMMVKGPQLKD